MAACPVCQSQLEITAQHFGTLYNCPRCNAVFFVDWDGKPEGAPAEEESLAPVTGESFTPPANEFQNAPEHNFSSGSEPNVESFASQDQNYQQDQSFDANQSSEPPAAYATDEEVPVDNYDFDQPLGQVADPTEPVGGPVSEKSTFSEITDFGNADVTQAAFNYTVTIAGIDTAVIYTQVKEALTDSKFGWNIIQIMTQAKDGVLTIRSVNAVKASILIQRVKYLPVKVSWRQDVL
ncbi:MAG: hypothetical protein H7326_03965, partial [Bdellovibrionaceae bacterium]|nr:hypothetical protein [Pseudobdellovibrionaceae bacterium]